MNTENRKNTAPSRGGFYSNITMSLRSANALVLISCVLLIAVGLFIVHNAGFTVRFDTDGGSAVETQTVFHSEHILPSKEPHKEGYTFVGWYRDRACTSAWDLNTDVVVESMTLYAGWEKDTD